MVKFDVGKKIEKVPENLSVKEKRKLLDDLIQKGFSTKELLNMGFPRRKINRRQAKIKSGTYLKRKKPIKSHNFLAKKKNDEISNLFKCKLEDIKNEIDLKYINYCKETIKSEKYKKSNEIEKNKLLKKCRI